MTRCNLSPERLQQWLDGELNDAEVSEHIEFCSVCEARVERLEHAQMQLRGLIDEGVGDVEPLFAVQKIHAKVAESRQRDLGVRLRVWWQDLWSFNRRAVAGMAFAAAIGAVSAPAVLMLASAEQASDRPTPSPAMASVVVESLEFAGRGRAMVYQPEDSATTIIWLENADR